MVTTSLSNASLQMGRLYSRQKARVHWVQEAEAARLERDGWWVVNGFRERRKFEGLVDESGLPADESLGPRRTMVLLLKQVHLQNVGAAVSFVRLASAANRQDKTKDDQERVSLFGRVIASNSEGGDVHSAAARAISAPKSRNIIFRRIMMLAVSALERRNTRDGGRNLAMHYLLS